MKKFLLILFCAGLTAGAQDTLIFKNQTKLVSLVLWVGEDSVRYKKIENITGPDLYAYNSELNLIKYKNGRIIQVDSLYQKYSLRKKVQKQAVTIETDVQPKDSLQGIAHDNSVQMYKEGSFHAEVNYRCKGCKIGFFTMGLAFGPAAFLSAISIALMEPRDKKLNYPSDVLWQNEDYKKGYKDKAGAIKRRAIFRGTTVGVIFSVFTAAVLANVLSKP